MGTSAAVPTEEQVADWISVYLREHAKAADTAAGIQRWWLAPTRGEVVLETVERALAKLEREGVMQISDPLAPNPVYGRGPNFVASP